MQMPTETQIPEYVPPNLVYDFHLFGDSGYIADPYARAQQVLAEAPPLFWSPRAGCWYATRHAMIIEIMSQPGLFSNSSRPAEEKTEFAYSPIPLTMDPPQHTKYVAPLKAAFSPRSMKKLDSSMRALAVQCIDPIVAKGECNFIEAVAEPLPILLFLSILGVPADRMAPFRKVAIEYIRSATMEIMMEHAIAADIMMSEFIEERRKRPQDDLISQLWATEIDGRPLTFDEMRSYGLMLFSAGLDTVTNEMGHQFHHLARNPALQDYVVANPGEISVVAEELLRRHSIACPPRRVVDDMEFHGVNLHAGDKIQLWLVSANLDPEAFADPTEIKLRRSEGTHLTFGYGVHRCVGAQLARMEIHILYEEWFKRIPRMSLDPNKKVIFDPGHILSIMDLPLQWSP